MSSTGQEYEYFAREADIVVVDIDRYEHLKGTVKIDRVVNGDLRELLRNDRIYLKDKHYADWAKQCLKWKNQYPVCLPAYYDYQDGIDLYVFMNELSKCLKEDSVVVTDAGSAVYVPAQAIKTTNARQRYITSGAQAEMGFTLPAAVGVCVAREKGEVIGITGDGSLQMNIQELQTLVGYHLPVKLFVWNNDGYLSIRATQNKFFDGRFIGTDKTSGVTFPNLEKIADAYGIQYKRVADAGKLRDEIDEVLGIEAPVIIEVMCRREQEIIPTVSSKTDEAGRLVSAPIEDMYPFLPRDEFEKNMIIKPIS